MSTLLVVDDTQDNLDLVADLLEDDHTLVFATSGKQGIDRARETRPDLILLDMGLPEMDGWEVVRHLKADEKLAAIPVIALTAHAMKGDRERCLAAGCDGYMAKPIDVHELSAMVERFLALGEA